MGQEADDADGKAGVVRSTRCASANEHRALHTPSFKAGADQQPVTALGPGTFGRMERIRSGAFVALILASSASAQNVLQRTLQNDTMPNLVRNPGFEESERLYCSWTQDAAKFSANVAGWNSP